MTLAGYKPTSLGHISLPKLDKAYWMQQRIKSAKRSFDKTSEDS